MLGLFGKMPANGDFLSKGFSPELVDGLDKMFQSVLVAVAESSDGRAIFEATPAFMLNIRPGTLSPSGFTGIVVPSCDRVGRLFPLCVGSETPPMESRLPLLWPSRGLSVALLQVVGAALERGDGADGLYRALHDMPSWDTLSNDTVPFKVSDDDTVPRLPANAIHNWYEGPEQRMGALQVAYCGRLAWVAELLGVTLAPNGDAAAFFATRSLLSWTHMAAAIDGRWEFWGWSSHFLATSALASESAVQDPAIDIDATRPRAGGS